MSHDHAPGFLALTDDARARVKEITLDDFVQRLQTGEQFIVLDNREDHEWAAGHLPGAHHMSKGVIERDIENAIPQKDAPIVCYCGGGFRSLLVADNLQRMGYTNVRSLAGGWREWTERSLPTVVDEAAVGA